MPFTILIALLLFFQNGNLDLRGKGMDLQLIRNGAPTTLVDCKPYLPPK